MIQDRISNMLRIAILVATTTALSAAIASCGGGGGGGGSDDGSGTANYPGSLTLSVERDRIDSGDMDRVRIEINDLNPDGAILKFHYPNSLRYVENSAILFPDREEQSDISPYDEVSIDGERYLVFFLYSSSALNDAFISLEFDLKATKSNSEAYVEVDLDNNDLNILDSLEFKASSPRFTALERWDIVIEAESTDPTPTPGPTKTPRK